MHLEVNDELLFSPIPIKTESQPERYRKPLQDNLRVTVCSKHTSSEILSPDSKYVPLLYPASPDQAMTQTLQLCKSAQTLSPRTLWAETFKQSQWQIGHSLVSFRRAATPAATKRETNLADAPGFGLSDPDESTLTSCKGL